MLLIHQQTKLGDMRSSLTYNSWPHPTHTFDSMSWDKSSLQIPGDSDVASILEPTIYSKVIYTIITRVAECLSLLKRLIADLLLEVIRIHGNTDTVLVTQSFNCFG